MTSARALRARACKIGATAALTLVASGVITAGTTSAASADIFCDDAGVVTSATGDVSVSGLCFSTELPYVCSHPRAGVDPTVGVYADFCVID